MADPSGSAGRAGPLVGGLLERAATLGTTRLLAIDGPAGAGKTTLAQAVLDRAEAEGLTATVVAMDDLYDGWSGLTAELEPRVLEQLLRPLAAGRPARWQRYDWAAGTFAEWHDLAPPDVLVLEGCGSGARAYASYTTLLVWVDADEETRRRRAVERDGLGLIDHWDAWTALEVSHYRDNDTRRRADVVVGA